MSCFHTSWSTFLYLFMKLATSVKFSFYFYWVSVYLLTYLEKFFHFAWVLQSLKHCKISLSLPEQIIESLLLVLVLLLIPRLLYPSVQQALNMLPLSLVNVRTYVLWLYTGRLNHRDSCLVLLFQSYLRHPFDHRGAHLMPFIVDFPPDLLNERFETRNCLSHICLVEITPLFINNFFKSCPEILSIVQVILKYVWLKLISKFHEQIVEFVHLISYVI